MKDKVARLVVYGL